MERFLQLVEMRRKEQRRWLAMVLCLSIIVSMCTFAGFHKDAIAKTYTRRVLDCPYAAEGMELVAHRHNCDCYDENGALVCPLEEIENNQSHTDSCSANSTILKCDLEESDGHRHDQSCYSLTLCCAEEEHETIMDEAGNVLEAGHIHSSDCYTEVLSCGLEEGEGAHDHTEECYESNSVLSCTEGELPVHIHDAACFRTEEITVEEQEETHELTEESVPSGPVEEPEAVKETAEKTDGEIETSEENVDENIGGNTELKDSDAETAEENETEDADLEEDGPGVILPAQSWEQCAGGIKVSVEAPDGAFPPDTTMSLAPVNGNLLKSAVAGAVNGEVLEVQAVDITFIDKEGSVIEPGVPIRVSIVPADSMHAEQTAQVVHIDHDGDAEIVEQADDKETREDHGITFDAEAFSIYAVVYTVDFEYTLDGKVYQFSISGGEAITLSELAEALGILEENNHMSAEDFTAEVEDVRFSDESLVKVIRSEEDTTIGEILQRLETDQQLSAPYGEKETLSNREKPVQRDEWVLISLRPFDTQEELTITMKDGNVVTVKVTDDQTETWNVTINLYDYDGCSPAPSEALEALNGKTYAIMAVLRNKTSGDVVGYQATGAVFENGHTAVSCSMGLGSFKTLGIDVNDGKPIDTYQSIAYDSEVHDISFRLYEGTERVDQWQHKDYRSIISLPDYADGFEFLEAPNGNVQDAENKSTTLNMKRAFDKQFNLRLQVEPTGLEITESDSYYALVTVEHQTTGKTYAFSPITVSHDQTVKDIPITEWYDQNGNPLPNEKFSGNETVRVELYTSSRDENGNKLTFHSLNEFKNNQSKVLLAEGDSVNRYNVHYAGMQEPVPDNEQKKTYYYSVIGFLAPAGNISKGDIDRLLDDATDFGYYTERYIGHSGDIEATIGTDYLDTEFLADFAYSNNNLSVNCLKVLKIYTDENGCPVQKPVTVQIRQKGNVVGEKTGTTDTNGRLELEFSGLGPGDYDIVEIIDGQEISGQGSASVSEQTINYNFSIDKAHFANNTNVNYFGTLGTGMDAEKLKTMIQKASRVDVVILTDTENDKRRIEDAKEAQSTEKNIDVVINGTAPYKRYDIPNDMIRLRKLSDDLANAQSSDTIRVINLKASEISENGLSYDDDGRYIVLNIVMDQNTFCPYVCLDGKLVESDYGQSGKSNSSKILYNLRSVSGECYTGDVNTSKQGAGIILAPDANAHVLGGPFGGTIITNRVNRAGNELHSNNPSQIQTLNAVIQNVTGEPTTGILQLSKKFADNTKDKVTYFTFKVRLENDDEETVRNATFPATGLRKGDSVTFDADGEALVDVRAGNSVAIASLPAGTRYTVEEIITPATAHFVLDRYEGREGTISAGHTSNAVVYNSTIPLNKRISVTVNKKWFDVSGNDVTDQHTEGGILFDLYRTSERIGDVSETATLIALTRAEIERLDSSKIEKVNTDTLAITAPEWSYASGTVLEKYVPGTTTEWTYFVKEHRLTGYDDSYELNHDTITIRNTENDTRIIRIEKIWKDQDGNPHIPNGASATVGLYLDGTATGETITLDGRVDGLTEEGTYPKGEIEAWTGVFEVPKDGRLYTVAEISVSPAGFSMIDVDVIGSPGTTQLYTPADDFEHNEAYIVTAKNRLMYAESIWPKTKQFSLQSDGLIAGNFEDTEVWKAEQRGDKFAIKASGSYLTFNDKKWKASINYNNSCLVEYENRGIKYTHSTTHKAYYLVFDEANNIAYSDSNPSNIQIYKKNTIDITKDLTYRITNQGTVTEPSAVELCIAKVDARDMSSPIAGAQFTLNRLNPSGYGDLAGGEEALCLESNVTATGDGLAMIAGIPDGYYEISETKIPDGYVLVDDGKFYIHVLGETLSLLTKNPEKTVENWDIKSIADNDKIQLIADSTGSTVIKVGNTPGTQLPSTGGVGAERVTAIGAFLASTAGIVLMLKKRKLV